MNHKENQKIAEYCGWFDIHPSGRLDGQLLGRHQDLAGSLLIGSKGVEIPDYWNDLNAMHEAEKALLKKPISIEIYGENLQEITNYYVVGVVEDYPRHLGSLAKIAHATAPQRAEAFLKTITLE